jgi:energy-coupling factor transporter ATP-binding protein EcfA2
VIELREVTYSYPGNELPVLKNLSLEVAEGEFLLVIGASGSGKSTLLRSFNGLVPHFYGGTFLGEIRVAGRDPLAEGPRGMSEPVRG